MVLKTLGVGSDYNFASNIAGLSANGEYDGTAMFATGTPYNRFVSMYSTFSKQKSSLIFDQLLGYYEGSYFLTREKVEIPNWDLKKMRYNVSIAAKSIKIHFRITDDSFTFRHILFLINNEEYYMKTKNTHLLNVRGVTTYVVNDYQTTVTFNKDPLRDYMTFTLQYEVPVDSIELLYMWEFRSSNNCKIIVDVDEDTILYPLATKYELRSKSEIKSSTSTEYPEEYYSDPRLYMREFSLISPYYKFNNWFSLHLEIVPDVTLKSFMNNIKIVYENISNTFNKLRDPKRSNTIISLGCVIYYDNAEEEDLWIRFKNHPIMPIFSDHTIYVENRYKFLESGIIPDEIADLILEGANNSTTGATDDTFDGDTTNLDANVPNTTDDANNDINLTSDIQGNINLDGLIFPAELLLVQHDYDFGTNCPIYPRPEYIEYKVFDRDKWAEADFNAISYNRAHADEPLIIDCENPFIIWNEKDEFMIGTLHSEINIDIIRNYGGYESPIIFEHTVELFDQWTGTVIDFDYYKGQLALSEQSHSEFKFFSSILVPIEGIVTPTLISPDLSIDLDTTIDNILQGSTYYTINITPTHMSTDWLIASDTLFTEDSIVFESLDDEENLTSILIPAGTLLPNMNLYFKFRYKSFSYESEWYESELHTQYEPMTPTENIIRTWSAPDVAISGITYMLLPEGDKGFVTSDYSTKNIYVHDGKSSAIRTILVAPDSGIITGITHNDNNDLITCNSDTNKIYVHNGVSAEVLFTIDAPGDAVSDVTFDDDGNLIVCDSSTNNIYIMDGLSSNVIQTITPPEVNPRGITYFYGYLYVTSVTSDTIYRIDINDPDTDNGSLLAPSTYPTGLADGENAFYSTDLDGQSIYEHEIVIYEPNEEDTTEDTE